MDCSWGIRTIHTLRKEPHNAPKIKNPICPKGDCNIKNTSNSLDFWGPLKRAQMLVAHRDATGAYMEIREDRGFVGNAADGSFLEVPST